MHKELEHLSPVAHAQPSTYALIVFAALFGILHASNISMGVAFHVRPRFNEGAERSVWTSTSLSSLSRTWTCDRVAFDPSQGRAPRGAMRSTSGRVCLHFVFSLVVLLIDGNVYSPIHLGTSLSMGTIHTVRKCIRDHKDRKRTRANARNTREAQDHKERKTTRDARRLGHFLRIMYIRLFCMPPCQAAFAIDYISIRSVRKGHWFHQQWLRRSLGILLFLRDSHIRQNPGF